MMPPSEALLNSMNGSPTAVRRGETINWGRREEVLAAASHEDQAAPLRRIAALELIGRVLAADYVAWLDRDERGQWHCTQEGVAQAGNAAELRSAATTAAAVITQDARSGCHELSADRHVIVNHLMLP